MITPSHLYKYQKKTEYSLASLKSETVWLSTPASFNDPFDCAINLDRRKLKESVSHAVEQIAKTNNIPVEIALNLKQVTAEDEAAYEQLRKSLKEEMQTIGVLCLSETPSEILMWSHYADHHRGFCVEYELEEGSLLRSLAQPVNYTELFPSLSLEDLPKKAKGSFLDICIYTKAIQWSYEKEWRVIMYEGEKLFRAPAPVSSIIFGARMPQQDKLEVYEILRHKVGVIFKEAYLLEGLFGIGFRPFSA
jgi:hypothetical protein